MGRTSARRPLRDRLLPGLTLAVVLLLSVPWPPHVAAQEPAEPTLPAESAEEGIAGTAEESTSTRPKSRRRGDRVSVFGDAIHVPADVYQDGAVIAIGADVIIEGEVRDDVVVISGSLEMTGSARRSVVTILSHVSLDGARIGDQLVNVAGTLKKHDTEIDGQTVNIGFGDWLPNLPSSFGILGFFIFWGRLFKLLLTFVVILFLAALVPERIRNISEVAPARYAAAFFVGLLGYLGMLVLVAVVGITVIGLPVLIVIFLLLKWLGIVGIFHAVGQRIGRSLGRELSLLGAILLMFLPYALVVQLPLLFGILGLIASGMIGMFLWLFLEVPAVGLVLLTRAGGPGRAMPAGGPPDVPAARVTPPAPTGPGVIEPAAEAEPSLPPAPKADTGGSEGRGD